MENRFKQASAAHERVMINLSIFHLLLPVAALSSGYMVEILSISLIGSASIIAMIAWRAKSDVIEDSWVHDHWLLAWKRCKLLLIAYAISIGIMLIGFALASMQTDHNMGNIMLVIFGRIAAVPTVLIVLALFVMETTALSEARQGQDAE